MVGIVFCMIISALQALLSPFPVPMNIFFLPCLCAFSLGRKLRGKAFYFVNGKVFCEEDFLVSLSPKQAWQKVV